MQRIDNLDLRIWYMEQTIQNGWSRDILASMIKTEAHKRQGSLAHNFDSTLPKPQSDLVRQTLKDPYIFDFLTLTEPFQERELETELVKHVELKKGDFKPEYAGKMNFYCSAVDDLLKQSSDQPTIGLILCESKNKIFAEYALRDINKPIGVSEYELTRALPDNLKSSLPSIEEIEAELRDRGGRNNGNNESS